MAVRSGISPAIWCIVILWVIVGVQTTILEPFRESRLTGYAGRFAVDRHILSEIMKQRTFQDIYCGDDRQLTVFSIHLGKSVQRSLEYKHDQDVMLQLPDSLPHLTYDPNKYGEILISVAYFEDITLERDLPCSLRDQISTTYRLVDVSLPFVSKSEHGILSLIDFTDSEKEVMCQIRTNLANTRHIDSIEETDSTITLRKGNDVMVLNVQHNTTCETDPTIKEDFDDIIGKVAMKYSNYPMPFDMGCKIFGTNTSFCRVLREHKCDLRRIDGDVCTLSYIFQQKRCSASLNIVSMTGYFRDALPFLAESLPAESLESEWADAMEKVGLQFPCFT